MKAIDDVVTLGFEVARIQRGENFDTLTLLAQGFLTGKYKRPPTSITVAGRKHLVALRDALLRAYPLDEPEPVALPEPVAEDREF